MVFSLNVNYAEKAKLSTIRYAKQYRMTNKHQCQEYNKKWYRDNKSYHSIYRQTYVNPWDLNHRKDYKREYEREKRKDISYRIIGNLRSRLSRFLKKANNLSTMKDLGCTKLELKMHLEKQFQPGMTWENYGKGDGKWQVDHIFPISAAIKLGEKDLKKCFHYTNLQPLWWIDNLIKSDKILLSTPLI